MDFCDVIGQLKPLKAIKACIDESKFFGAYIFSGPQAIGKKMIAKIIAQKLNCIEADIDHPDIHLIEKSEAVIKIDDIRDIQRQANLRAYAGKMKVFIIDNAHKLNLDAANSLLKVLEEPPKDVLIILITHKRHNIIKTVLSRCKEIKFSPLAKVELEEFLIKKYLLEQPVAHFLSYYCEGSIGLALKLKDTDIFNEKNKIFDSFLFSAYPAQGKIMEQSKEQLHIFLNILASWFRDVYLLKAGLPDTEVIHADRKDNLLKQAAMFSFKQLDDIFAAISESLLYLEMNINSKLLLHNLGAHLWKA
jgi:DNA polymerase III subunit delta'